MIEVTKINGVKVLVNPDLIELVEETPDTVLTLTTGFNRICRGNARHGDYSDDRKKNNCKRK